MYVSIINPLNILASLQTGKITAMVHIEHGEIHKNTASCYATQFHQKQLLAGCQALLT